MRRITILMTTIFLPLHFLFVFTSAILALVASGAFAQNAAGGSPRLNMPMTLPSESRPVRSSLGGDEPVSAVSSASKPDLSVPPVETRDETPPLPAWALAGAPSAVPAGIPDAVRNTAPPILDQQAELVSVRPGHSPRIDRQEMIDRMRYAVEQIAAEYGSPAFTQIFTNDVVRAQVIRRRMGLLMDLEALNAEIVSMTRQRETLQEQVKVTARQLDVARGEMANVIRQKESALRESVETRRLIATFEQRQTESQLQLDGARRKLEELQTEARVLQKRLQTARVALSPSEMSPLAETR